ncbi:MAG: hypothetical protein M8863_01850, partial [marine benthic group bacterium]|nr:hypothetical protein [Gemmatimonadota bacterium]
MPDLSPARALCLPSTINSDVRKPDCPVNLLAGAPDRPFYLFFHMLSTHFPQLFFKILTSGHPASRRAG